MAELVRTLLRSPDRGPWFQEAAERLRDFVRGHGVKIPAESLPEVHPSFATLKIGFADAAGLLHAAGCRRIKAHSGDYVVLQDKVARYKRTMDKAGRPPPAPQEKPEATVPEALPGPPDLLKLVNDLQGSRKKGRVGWRDANLRKSFRKRRPWRDHARKVRKKVSTVLDTESQPLRPAAKLPPNDPGKHSWKTETSRENQVLAMLGKRPMFGNEITHLTGTSRQNANFLIRRLLKSGRIRVLPIPELSKPICNRLAVMSEKTAQSRLRKTRDKVPVRLKRWSGNHQAERGNLIL